jgi:CBS-domain-containing membrane protein
MEPEIDKTEVVSDTHEQDHRLPDGMQPPRRPSGRIDREHPIGGEMSDILRGLLRYIRLPWLIQRYAQTPVLALFSCINGCISIGLMSVLAVLTHSPFVFPSLGPTAFLFFYTPTAPSASPRNTLIGHAVGAGAGYLSLVVTGLTMAGPALAVGVTWPRVIAAGLSLGLTSGLMVLFKSPHPPAGATTLIISLGILTKPWQLLLLMVAVVLLTLQALAINRLAGIPYPLWNPIKEKEGSSG